MNVQVHQACRVAAVNAELGTLVGLVDKDEAAALSGYLAEIYDRHKVGFVSLGPSGPALAAVELVLPDAVPYLDKPHVLGMVDRAVRGVRRAVRRDVTRQVRDKHLLDDGLILERRLRDLPGSIFQLWRCGARVSRHCPMHWKRPKACAASTTRTLGYATARTLQMRWPLP